MYHSICMLCSCILVQLEKAMTMFGVSRDTCKSTTCTRSGKIEAARDVYRGRQLVHFSCFCLSSRFSHSPRTEVSIFAVLPLRGIIRSALHYSAKRPCPFSQKDHAESFATIPSDNHRI